MLHFKHTLLRTLLAAALLASLFAGCSHSASAQEREPVTLTLKIDDRERTALVYGPAPPASTNSANSQSSVDKIQPHPLVFVFHGHGGSAELVARSFDIHDLWPEAIVAYPQGIPTPGKLTDPEGKRSGWQHSLGAEGDRDLKFFDALLARLKSDYQIDDKRIYATGHSNGGGFTFILWCNRGEVFAAVAPSSAAMSPTMKKPKPLPVIELAGENDPLVKYEWQKLTMDFIKKLNGCESTGQPSGEFCTEYASPTGTPFVAYIHTGGHQFPKGASKRFVEFFQQHKKP